MGDRQERRGSGIRKGGSNLQWWSHVLIEDTSAFVTEKLKIDNKNFWKNNSITIDSNY